MNVPKYFSSDLNYYKQNNTGSLFVFLNRAWSYLEKLTRLRNWNFDILSFTILVWYSEKMNMFWAYRKTKWPL